MGIWKQEYYRAGGAAKRAIFQAKDAERRKFCEDLAGEDGKGNVFRLAKQLVSETEMLWVQAVWRMMTGRLWLRKMSWWKSGEHIMIRFQMRRLLGTEMTMTNVSPVCGVGLVKGFQHRKWVWQLESKASQRVLRELWQRCTLWMTVCYAVVKDDKVPEDWSRMVNVYKSEEDALTFGSYRGISCLNM